jgi:hypothetical protein
VTKEFGPSLLEFDHGPLRRSTQENREFGAARELRDWVERLTGELHAAEEWMMTPGEPENLYIGTFARGTKTYRAVLLLADRGYGEQAAMLNRSLFEHMLVMWWMSHQNDQLQILEKVRRHHDHARVLYERAAGQHPELDLEPGRGADPLSEEYIAALDKEFGSYGGQWHGMSLANLVREVEDGWNEPYPGVLWKFLRFVNHWNNYMLHHSAVGVSEGVRWQDPDEAPMLRLGPTRDWVRGSLWAAFWFYGLLVLCTLRRLSPARAEGFREFFEDLGYRFIVVTRDQAKDVGRNSECPCGSGKKFKSCHDGFVAD